MNNLNLLNKNTRTVYKIIEEITTGGSDRRFYRIKKGKTTYVLIEDRNIKDYIKFLIHLLQAGIGVPKLIEFKDNYAIVEDLGKESLYSLMCKRQSDWMQLYKKAIAELVKLQVDGYENAPVDIYYDSEHIKWEQDYFKNFFLKQYCRISDKKISGINEDFKILHEKVVTAIKPINNFLMHRDYQSQNIFIKNGRIRIVDFQSVRIGPLTYDLVSLLRDAYVKIDKKNEDDLISYYLSNLKQKGINVSKAVFFEAYRLTAIQRHMQALGAFANLSLNKNKPHFRRFISPGLKLLAIELKQSEFIKLANFISSIEQLWSSQKFANI